jgi:hypothetical protein
VPVSIDSTASTIIHGIIGNVLTFAISLTLGALLPALHTVTVIVESCAYTV